MVASEDVGIWGGLWMQVMSDLLLPLMADLARLVSTRSKEFPGRLTKGLTHVKAFPDVFELMIQRIQDR